MAFGSHHSVSVELQAERDQIHAQFFHGWSTAEGSSGGKRNLDAVTCAQIQEVRERHLYGRLERNKAKK
ncbi:MAG: hypothetical protein KME45_04200 [Stenomitos rutilans HA7619-LM2]|jgi:hypothetical protein|nr:hypothetical protein [Stenomitos rutilans HA7619-LM2]